MTQPTPHTPRQQILRDAVQGLHGSENQCLASALNLYVAQTVAWVNEDRNPVNTMGLVVATDEAVIAFAAYVVQPSSKTRKAYMRKLDYVNQLTSDYLCLHG